MDRAITPEEREILLKAIESPPLGSPLNKARRYGVNLRVLVDNLSLTPTERMLKWQAQVNLMLERGRRKQLRKAMRKKKPAADGPHH
jgi:hypothetical protein